jgi:glutathione S-transferase
VKLYAFFVAPNPTRERLYLAEKAAAGKDLGIEEVAVNLREGEQKSPEHQARNPFEKLPVLELDDGSFLTESLPIIEYLEELHPEPPLLGSEPLERARVRELERIAELSVLYPIARVVHSTNSPLGLPPSREMAAHFGELIPKGLKVLDDRLSDGRPFLAGECPSIADCTLAAALQFGRFGKVELDPAFENVARWDAAYRERPPAQSVLVM